MNSPLSIYAGEEALSQIQSSGFNANMFTALLGASGGPKWFVLSGLDQVVFNEFLDKSPQHIDIIGSSAGAFRACCFGQDNPKEAILRLADKYANTVYSDKPSPQEITAKGLDILRHMMGETGINEVLNSVNKRVHIVTARCHGLVASENKAKQFSGLAMAAGRNAISRRKLQKSFTRAIFSSSEKHLDFSEKVPLNTEQYQLKENNFIPALMASGSIPVVIEGVKNIAGAKAGMYRDGGIIDYHFDMRINTPGLVLYPHFYSTPVPGWFDKSIKRRVCHHDSYKNVVMLVPSEEFVANLPFGKIPDRKDFETMDAPERIKYWQRVLLESERLGDEFLNIVTKQNVEALVKPINLRR